MISMWEANRAGRSCGGSIPSRCSALSHNEHGRDDAVPISLENVRGNEAIGGFCQLSIFVGEVGEVLGVDGNTRATPGPSLSVVLGVERTIPALVVGYGGIDAVTGADAGSEGSSGQ